MNNKQKPPAESAVRKGEAQRRKPGAASREALQLPPPTKGPEEGEDHWVRIAWKHPAVAPRAPVEVLLGEALELRALIASLPPCPLLSSNASRDLKQIVALARRAHLDFKTHEKDRSQTVLAAATRKEGVAFMGRVARTLRFLGECKADEGLLTRLGRLNTKERTEDGLAMEVSYCLSLVETYQDDLRALDPSFGVQAAELTLSRRLLDLSAQRLRISAERSDRLALRNQLLALLASKVRLTRRTLRYAFHEDPEILRRLRSEYLKKKRRGSKILTPQ